MSVHSGKSGSHSFPCGNMVNGSCLLTRTSLLWLKWCYWTAAWYLQSCSIGTQRAAFSACHYLRIKTSLSSWQISEESTVCSHEGAIRPCLAMRRQHVLTYFQHSECVCLQPNRQQISEEPLNGTYKLIAKWLKSLGCYLSVSLREALCHSSTGPISLLPTNHSVSVQFGFFLP